MSNNAENFICGVVEGFYGRPWTSEQREGLFEKMKKWCMNTYVYAPKDDSKHRLHWRELYSPEEADQLTNLIAAARRNGIDFYYALSPGIDIVYSSEKELNVLKRKLEQVHSFGCECFALLFDDIENEMCAKDKEKFSSFAFAQVSVSNEIYNHLNCPRFLFCPTQYCTSRALPDPSNSEYLNTLGEKLLTDICILWTGKNVISKTITETEILQITEVLKRKPLIWDNLHANDYDPRRVFLGPYQGRDPSLRSFLRGVVTNPNCEFQANFIACQTLAHWSRCETESKETNFDANLETENEHFTEEEFNSDKCYNPQVALKKAIVEWQYEFSIKKEAPSRPIGCKPQPNIVLVPPIAPTCLALISSTIDSEVCYSGSMETTTTTTAGLNSNFNILGSPILPIMSAKIFQNFSNSGEGNSVDNDENKMIGDCSGKVQENTEEQQEKQVLDDKNKAEKMMTDSIEKLSSPSEEVMMDFSTPKHSAKGMISEDVMIASTSSSNMQIESDLSSDITCDEKQPSIMTTDDIGIICDLFYLPFEHGKTAVTLIEEFNFLKTNARIMNRSVGASEIETGEWKRRSKSFIALCELIKNITKKLASSNNMEICFDLFPYAWSVTSVLTILCGYVEWLELGFFPMTCPTNFNDANLTWFSKSWQDAFSSGNHEPWSLRGGLISDLQKLIPIDPVNADLFCYKLPDSPTVELYSIRPYRNIDESILYKICIDCHLGSEIYPGDLYADRNIGPFLTLNPEKVLVLEDSQKQICGYIAVESEISAFYRRQNMCWFDEMMEKYPLSMLEDCSPQAKEMIQYFHHLNYEWPEIVLQSFPSILTISILRDQLRQDTSIPLRLLTLGLSLLKSIGAQKGAVHVPIGKSSIGQREFYENFLGFTEICDDDHFVYLGRNF